MTPRNQYTYPFSNLLNEQRREIQNEYKHDIRMACICYPVAALFFWLVLAL